MNKEELIKKIEEGGGVYIQNEVTFKFIEHDTKKEENKYAIEATTNGFNFHLWSHQDAPEEFYCDVSIEKVNEFIDSVQKLSVIFDLQLLKDIRPIEIIKTSIQETPETFLNKGKVEAMEFIFNSHNKITLEK